MAELQQHYIEGRLTSEELSERVGHALEARTFGDLAPLLADLPAPTNYPVRAESLRRSLRSQLLSPPVGALLIAIGVLAMLWLFVFPSHFGILPFWPVLIWGVFFVGRPYRRRF